MDISALSTAASTVSTASNLILVSPQKTVGYQPQKFPSFVKDTSTPDDAFLFHYEGEQAMTLTSEITDHYTEQNEAINDQIALRPETFSTQGFIGELNDVVPLGLQPLKIVADKLTIIDGYTPGLSVTALKAYNDAALAYSIAANAASSALKSIDALAGTDGNTVINGSTVTSAKTRDQNKQQIAFQKFYTFWKNKTLFTIQTPWAIFQDMAIQTIHVVQDPETDTVSQFDITFKIMRFATTQELDQNGNVVGSDEAQARASAHAALEQDLGTQTMTTSGTLFNPAAA